MFRSARDLKHVPITQFMTSLNQKLVELRKLKHVQPSGAKLVSSTINRLSQESSMSQNESPQENKESEKKKSIGITSL